MKRSGRNDICDCYYINNIAITIIVIDNNVQKNYNYSSIFDDNMGEQE